MMFDVLFVILYSIYFFVAIYVEKWTALATLANKQATPRWFVAYPEIFLIANTVLFFALGAATLFTAYISKYISLPLILLTFLGVVSIGRRLAYKTYSNTIEFNTSYGEFHQKLIDNKRVIKKRWFKDGRPIK